MRCHYVPQFYLKNFSISGKTGSIFAYKRGARPFVVSINKIAAKNDLYIYTDKNTGKKSDEIEKMFSWLESLAAPIIDKINSGTSLLELSNKEHNILSEFIAYLYVRNLGFREKQKNLISAGLKIQMEFLARDDELFNKLANDTGCTSKEEIKKLQKQILNFDEHFHIGWGNKNNDYFLKQALSLALEISPKLFYKDWHIIDNQTSRIFITSDNPVILMRPPNLPPYYGSGIINSHIVVPISPTKAILLNPVREKPEKPRIIKASRGLVSNINRHTMFYANKFIYANLESEDIKNNFDKTEEGKSERVRVS